MSIGTRAASGRALASGFALVEVAIGLVVVGLMIGGVLVGRELMRSGEIQKVVGEVQKINAGINTFKSKYDCLPGDCVDAGQHGLSVPPGSIAFLSANSHGLGSGAIEMAYPVGLAGTANRFHLVGEGYVALTIRSRWPSSSKSMTVPPQLEKRCCGKR